MRKRFQEGGLAADDDRVGFGLDLLAPDEPGIGGPLTQMDPTTALMSVFAQQYTTTPEAQEFSRRILEQSLDPTGAPESRAIQAKRQQAEQVRQALRKARETLLAQDYNRGDILLAASQAMGQPTRTGALGETAANVFGAIREPLAARRKFGRDRDAALAELDLAEAQADTGVTDAEFELEKLQQTLQNALAREALDTLGKSTTAGSFAGVRPAAMRALDAEYAKEFVPFVQGGSAKAAQGIATLEFAESVLREGSDALTGPAIGGLASIPLVGRYLQAVASPEGADIRDLIEQTIQESLRPILGSQFTQQEGERLIARTYNPQLEEWRNARRLGWLNTQLREAYKNKVAMAEYFSQNQTLAGFRGKLFYSVDDFIPPPEVGQEDGAQAPQQELRHFSELSEAEQATVRKRYEERTGKPAPFKKGGQVRKPRYQRGGVVLPTGEILEDEKPTEQSGLDQLVELATGEGPSAVAGAGAGLATESALNRLLQRALVGQARWPMEGMERAGIDPAEAAMDVKRGRRAGVPQQLMDVDAPGVQVLAERALQAGGEDATQALEDLRDRVEGSRERVRGRVNVAMKPYPYFEHEDRLVNQVSNEARRDLFQPIFDKAGGLPLEDDVLKQIMETPEGQRATEWAMRFYRNQPNKSIGQADALGMVRKPNLEFYDYIRKGFDQIIAREEKGGATEFSEVLRDLRKTFVDRLDELAPQEYREARQQYGGDLEIRDALREGRNFMRFQPEQLAQRAAGLTFHEKNAFRTGIAQKLYEMMDASSSQSVNTAQKIIGSPAMVERLKPFFDNPQEFKIFQTALEREAELFRSGSELVGRAEDVRLRAERARQTPAEYLTARVGGLRYAPSFTGWVLRVWRDLPKMTKGQAEKMLELLQQGSPEEMDAFARKARTFARLRRTRTGRRAAAAAIGAGIGAVLGEDDEPQE